MMLISGLTEGTRRFERWVSIAVLALMSALPLIEIAGRRLAGGGIPGSIPVVQHLTLWITFLGAALAAGSDRLLALSTGSFLPDRWQARVRLVTSACGAAVSGSLLVASLDLVSVEREAGDIIGWGIPVWVAVSIMPLGFGLVAGRMIWRSSERGRGRLAAACGLVVPVLVFLYKDATPAGLLLPGSLVILCATALGMPIFAALGGAALLFFWGNGVPIAAVPSETYRLSASPMLPAIPLFTLGGYLISEGGAGRRLMRTFTALVGWMPGGLAIVTTLLLAFFTPFTGASGVTILSMGGLLLPMLLKARYPEPTAVGLVTVSGSIGLLFPPSLPVILYGIYAQTPIDRLFIAGLVPGALLVLVVAGWGAWRGWSAGAERTPFSVRELLAATWEAKWELLLPVVVLTGLFGGFATLVEAAALTVLYALVVECFVYRDLSVRRDLPRIAVECSTLAGGFLIILGAALGFTNFLIHAEIPTLALHWARLHIQSPLLFLLALNGFLIVIGALMDIYSAILVIVPLITPMGLAYGIDPVHLGIVFLANMELGYLMPPMGENLFLSSYRFKQPLSKIYLATVPYSLMLLGAVLLITYLPYLFSL
jgi:C4-dicarboxylate transporter, DctM subunit